MSIELPQPRLPQTATPRLVDWGADLTPPMGGPSQRLNRVGDRFSLEITYPRLKPEPDGRILMARLRRAKREGALFPFPQLGFDVGNVGTNTVVADGARQGTQLTVGGFPAGYTVQEGQFFSLIYGGQRYLHYAVNDCGIGNDAVMTLTIFPMLRVVPNVGATLEFAKPYIEGVLSGNEVAVELAIARATPATITITERD